MCRCSMHTPNEQYPEGARVARPLDARHGVGALPPARALLSTQPTEERASRPHAASWLSTTTGTAAPPARTAELVRLRVTVQLRQSHGCGRESKARFHLALALETLLEGARCPRRPICCPRRHWPARWWQSRSGCAIPTRAAAVGQRGRVRRLAAARADGAAPRAAEPAGAADADEGQPSR